MNVAHKYQAVQISTSSPGELLVALFDGLFRFLNQARIGLANGRRGPAGEAISKAHAIVSELQMSLDPRHAPELCSNLMAVYDFCMRRLTQANLKSDPAGIDEVILALTPVREAFTTVVRSGTAAQGQGQK